MRRGKPYSAIAKLAESVHAFVAMDRGLRALGFSAPRSTREDLDDRPAADRGSRQRAASSTRRPPIPERYAEATRLLAELHATTCRRSCRSRTAATTSCPPYDLDALLIEVELLLDWYAPHIARRRRCPAGARPSSSMLWSEALRRDPRRRRDLDAARLPFAEPDLAAGARGPRSASACIDFQDAVLGHPAYDVASLLQDARVDVPAELELKLLGAYAPRARGRDPAFDMAAFARAYAILGAQRATKILGIFARLDKRDGKPRLSQASAAHRGLSRAATSPIRRCAAAAWYEAHLPSCPMAPARTRI